MVILDGEIDFLTVVDQLGATAHVRPVWERVRDAAPRLPPPVTTAVPEGWNLFWMRGATTLELKLLLDGRASWFLRRDDGGGSAGSMAAPAHLLSSEFVSALEEFAQQA